MVEKSYNKPVTDFNFGRHKDLSTLKSDIHLGLAASVNITFSGSTGLMVRASDSGSGDPGSILGRVGVFVSLSKRHLLPKSTSNTQE